MIGPQLNSSRGSCHLFYVQTGLRKLLSRTYCPEAPCCLLYVQTNLMGHLERAMLSSLALVLWRVAWICSKFVIKTGVAPRVPLALLAVVTEAALDRPSV